MPTDLGEMHLEDERAQIDRYVAGRIRARRRMLGLSQRQLAEMIGVSFEQARKYEIGFNRLSSAMLLRVAQALGVSVEYLFEGVASAVPSARSTPQLTFTELAKNFGRIGDLRQQEAFCEVAGVMAVTSPGREDEPVAP